jgi:hypothetical protein
MHIFKLLKILKKILEIDCLKTYSNKIFGAPENIFRNFKRQGFL